MNFDVVAVVSKEVTGVPGKAPAGAAPSTTGAIPKLKLVGATNRKAIGKLAKKNVPKQSGPVRAKPIAASSPISSTSASASTSSVSSTEEPTVTDETVDRPRRSTRKPAPQQPSLQVINEGAVGQEAPTTLTLQVPNQDPKGSGPSPNVTPVRRSRRISSMNQNTEIEAPPQPTIQVGGEELQDASVALPVVSGSKKTLDAVATPLRRSRRISSRLQQQEPEMAPPPKSARKSKSRIQVVSNDSLLGATSAALPKSAATPVATQVQTSTSLTPALEAMKRN